MKNAGQRMRGRGWGTARDKEQSDEDLTERRSERAAAEGVVHAGPRAPDAS